MRKILLFTVTVLFAGAAWLLISKSASRSTVGPLADGGFFSVLGWKIHPVGRQVAVDTLPMNTMVSPDGAHLLVLNAGYNPPSISVIELATLRETSRQRLSDAWLGMAAHGATLYVSGGSRSVVHEFTVSAGRLSPARTLPVPGTHFIGDLALPGDAGTLYAASLYQDSVFAVNLASGHASPRVSVRRPYRVLPDPSGKSLWISNWADARVTQHDAATGKLLQTVQTGEHPTDMVWHPDGRLFVAAANTNTVAAIRDGKVVETINVAMTPRMPPGMTPSGLALARDGKRLFVVCSDANVVAVVDLEKRTRVSGFLPTGWYPTHARELDGGRLIVLNGRGPRSHPNPRGPQPTVQSTRSAEGIRSDEYVGRIQTGSISVIDALTPATLRTATRQAFANTPYQDKQLDVKGGFPPIRHAVYIIKENRTYDQVFGAVKEGNGDPSLLLFGEEITPNHHKLAREFVLLDNFYVNADVSADGHNWSVAAIAPDYVQRTWQNRYGNRGQHFSFPHQEPSATTPSGYIWNRVAEAGRTIRNYGYLGVNIAGAPNGGAQVSDVKDAVLKPVTDLSYRAYDLDYPDVERARVFLEDLAALEREGRPMANLTLMRLGNDHTHGASPGRLHPFSMVADNDLALGRIVEGISKSRFWPHTAIFVLEDDSQAGPDHVDSHRSPAFVISPYVRRGTVDSSFYNTTSMLRSIELILGARPMTVFDASSPPMYSVFSNKPDPRPYTHAPARVPLDRRNAGNTTTAARSERLDFGEADLNDDQEFNDILWRHLRATEPPPPTRSYFGR